MMLPSAADIEGLYTQYHTPPHIQDHMRVVAALATQLATRRAALGETITIPLVEAAARLHDLVRLPEQWVFLPPTITPPLPHAAINYLLLRDRWSELAAIVREHSLMTIFQPTALQTRESQIVYYADKRVNHTTIVSISDRLKLGQERWTVQPGNDRSVEVLAAVLELEKKLLSGIEL